MTPEPIQKRSIEDVVLSFSGSYQQKLDNKRRVSISHPFHKKMRMRNGSHHKHIYLLPDQLEGRFVINIYDPRYLSNNTSFSRYDDLLECMLDKQHRIQIPQNLMDYASLTSPVTLSSAPNGDYIYIAPSGFSPAKPNLRVAD